jgi:tetratricopeptide (TPR) repeat protein
MTRRALTLVAVLLVPVAAAAQPKANPRDEAKLHFKKGDEHYAKKEYDQAIVEFKKAYELSKLPLILFNIAQAYRLKGESKAALAYYEDYLRLDPGTPSRAQVEQRIEELEKAIAEEEKRAQPPPAPPTPTPAPPPIAAPPQPAPPPPRVEEEISSRPGEASASPASPPPAPGWRSSPPACSSP